MPEFFNSSLGLKLAIPQVAREIVRFMKDDSRRKYKIMIGTDSQRLNDGRADFVTAVVVHRIGNGGRYFWRRAELGKFHTLRDRIIQEVVISLELGKEVLAELKKFSSSAVGDTELACSEPVESVEVPEWEFEIHADVGEHGPTKAMIQEVVGMIRAHNFEAITKPGSYAASNVADRHV
ncbi:MAG: ribonuclease H-like YkuK family protein [Candidatus Liptonbacteria bacterium]|nr:ribonuclease H-like YkuK family protein [Candidatus Liptonbacteria bacterium]